MTRCPNCGHAVHEAKHVSLADPRLPEGEYRTERVFRFIEDVTNRREPREGREL